MDEQNDEYNPKQAFAEIDAAFIDKRVGGITYDENQMGVTIHFRGESELRFYVTQTSGGILLVQAEEVRRHSWGQINITPEGMS